MLSAQHLERLRRVFADTFEIEEDEVSEDSSPQSVPAWTSLNHLTLMSAVEEEFGAQFSMEEMSAVHNFSELKALIGQYV